MSLKSILHDIGQFISNLFKKIDPVAKTAIDFAIKVVEGIKNFDTSVPFVGDLITKLIPGDADDKIVALVRAKLPQIVIELRLVDSTLGLTDPNEILMAAIKVIQQLDGDYKSSFLHDLAVLIARVGADGKLDWSDAIIIAEWFFKHKDDPSVDTTV